jgi:23S rRNA (guanosine2251-2'-O)-methyltransferase
MGLGTICQRQKTRNKPLPSYAAGALRRNGWIARHTNISIRSAMTGRKSSQKQRSNRRRYPDSGENSGSERASKAGRDSGRHRAVGAEPQKTPRKPAGSPQGFWLYGIHAVSAALANPERNLLQLVATAGAADTLPPSPIDIEIVERDAIDAVVPFGAVHQGVALLTTNLPGRTIADIARHADQHERTIVVALDQVTDPQNVGAALRSAAAFGAYAVLAPDRHTPDATGALAKAASGALETVPLIRPNNLVRALEALKDNGFWVIGLDMDAPQSLPEADLPDRCILALGAEGRGLRRLTRETCDLMVRVPMTGAIESLNVSASAAVALYEWVRSAKPSATANSD